MTSARTRVGIVNPLPSALAHYEAALETRLASAGADVVRLPSVSIEGRGRDRAAAAVNSLVQRRPSTEQRMDRILVTWPVFGHLDLFLRLRPRAHRLTVVMHDPEPLRPQFGTSRSASTLARTWSGGGDWMVHSVGAARAMQGRGLTAETCLPLPMLEPSGQWRGGATVLVLGQYKQARDLDLLRMLAPGLRRLGLHPVIRGRGWPPVEGWHVRAEYLSEDAFDEAIAQAACVLLPYRLLFQSDVATRAAERGVPVVGPASSNVPDLYGASWPGAVPTGSPASEWLSRAAAVSVWEPADVLRRAAEQFALGESGWRSWLDSGR